MKASNSVLLVEDEALIALSLTDMLGELGFAVCGPADTARRAVELALSQRPALVLMDIRLKGRPDGIDAAREIRAQLPVADHLCDRVLRTRNDAAHASGCSRRRADQTDPARRAQGRHRQGPGAARLIAPMPPRRGAKRARPVSCGRQGGRAHLWY
jgi:two-component system, response regulator PdtaR